MPAPEYTAWEKNNDKFKQKGIPSKQRSQKPLKKPEFQQKTVDNYFSKHPGVPQKIRIHGGKIARRGFYSGLESQ